MIGVLIRQGRDSRGACIQRKDHRRTQQERAICKPKREASGETRPAHTLVLGFQPPELCEEEFLLFKLPRLQYFVMASTTEYMGLYFKKFALQRHRNGVTPIAFTLSPLLSFTHLVPAGFSAHPRGGLPPVSLQFLGASPGPSCGSPKATSSMNTSSHWEAVLRIPHLFLSVSPTAEALNTWHAGSGYTLSLTID